MSFPKKPGEAQKTIERWLNEEGFTYSHFSNPKALFNYAVTIPPGIIIHVLQTLNKKDSIVVLILLLFTNEQRKLFEQKTPIEREEILSEIQLKLALADVEFAFEAGKSPKIQIYHPIYYDALTKDRFFKSINTIHKTSKLARLILTRSL